MLSRYVPLSKCQFELVNPELYTEVYDPADPFRHGSCDADYLFATVMLSNPLFWMETQFLSDKARADLKSIIPIWKQYREAFTHADVRPIGEVPSGASLTGFAADAGEVTHLILFREATDRAVATFTLPVESATAEVLYSNADAQIKIENGVATAEFSKPRAYAFVKLN
jgi:hypothetical protein